MSAGPIRRVNKWPVLTSCFETVSDRYRRDLGHRAVLQTNFGAPCKSAVQRVDRFFRACSLAISRPRRSHVPDEVSRASETRLTAAGY